MKLRSKLFIPILLMFVMLGTIGGIVGAADNASDGNTIVDVAVADGRFTTLVAAAQAAGLDGFLADPNQSLTVFAPTDAAFAALPAGTVEGLLADPAALTNILAYHVVAGRFNAADVLAVPSLQTLQGDALTVWMNDGAAYVDNSKIIITDIQTSNGVIHVIDAVLIPGAFTPPAANTAMSAPAEAAPSTANLSIAEVAAADGRFSTLLAAAQAAGLDAPLASPGALTVFAPTDAAFAALPAGTVEGLLNDSPTLRNILSYHVLPYYVDSTTVVNSPKITTLLGKEVMPTVRDGQAFVNDARIVITDIPASNGIIHVIDAVLLPPAGAVPAAAEPKAEASGPTIVDVAVADGRFTTLVAAVQAAGLDGFLADPHQNLTVFAPTDAAFAALPAGTVEGLLADPAALTNILAYHVIAGGYTAADVLAVPALETLQGSVVNISVRDGKAYVNNSQIVITDIQTSNGVIHVIDAVLIPGTAGPMQ